MCTKGSSYDVEGMRIGWLRATGVALVLLVAACGGGDMGAPAGAEEEWFVERADRTGLDFVHVNGMTGRWLDAEIFGSGVGLIDYDNDGDLDAYFVQGGALGPGASLEPPVGDRLYRNELVPGEPDTLRFVDVTAQSGIVATGYGMGVAAGDIDNDGWLDLYVTNLGPNQLLRNNGDGTFADVTAVSGTGDPGWSVSASFVDVDRDGWLDLYVGNYLTYSVEIDIECVAPTGAPDYCAPTAYRAQPDRLFRSNGDGTFTDVTETALLGGAFGPALGVTAGDFDDDGWPDIYVANDGAENLLWMGGGDGTLVNQGLMSGAALNAAGRPEASMGVDAADADNDGDDDLFMTHWAGEKNTLYVQTEPGLFQDRTVAAGLVGPSLPLTGFGTGWLDADRDGWLDLLVVNGAVIAGERAGIFPLDEPNQLFRNLGNGRFEDVSARAGPALAISEVSRGAAFGDVDNDGDVDVLVGNNNGPARLLLNEAGSVRHWLGVRAVATGEPARDVIGARVGVELPDGGMRWRRVRIDGSYASASDPRVLIGLGDVAGPVRVRVRWPDGVDEAWDGLGIDRWVTLRQGEGQ